MRVILDHVKNFILSFMIPIPCAYDWPSLLSSKLSFWIHSLMYMSHAQASSVDI